MSSSSSSVPPIRRRLFWQAMLLNLVWMNLSEVFRYFGFVMPMMREAFPAVVNVAPMSWPVFGIWAVWDTVLVFCVSGFAWIYLERFGCGIANAIWGASFAWLGIFFILWLGLYNMNLATLRIVVVALTLSWIELVVAALLVNWCLIRNGVSTAALR